MGELKRVYLDVCCLSRLSDVDTMTLDQIRRAGLEALARELGPVGMVRFIKQFQGGHGDYTRDRFTWLGEQDVETIAKRILRRRGKKGVSRRPR